MERGVRDLVIVKTFVGLCFQAAILKAVADHQRKSYRLARPDEESKGIDGHLDDTPVSLKPMSYRSNMALPESIPFQVIFYEETEEGIAIEF